MYEKENANLQLEIEGLTRPTKKEGTYIEEDEDGNEDEESDVNEGMERALEFYEMARLKDIETQKKVLELTKKNITFSGAFYNCGH